MSEPYPEDWVNPYTTMWEEHKKYTEEFIKEPQPPQNRRMLWWRVFQFFFILGLLIWSIEVGKLWVIIGESFCLGAAFDILVFDELWPDK